MEANELIYGNRYKVEFNGGTYGRDELDLTFLGILPGGVEPSKELSNLLSFMSKGKEGRSDRFITFKKCKVDRALFAKIGFNPQFVIPFNPDMRKILFTKIN